MTIYSGGSRLFYLFTLYFCVMKAEKENTDKEIEQINEIRKLMQSLTFDDIADDFSIFTELVLKEGMSIIL